MIATAMFFSLLALPGFALLRRTRLLPAEGGPLGVLALSYLASLVLLSPFSIAGYALHLPVAAFSAATASLVVIAAASLAREPTRVFLAPPWPRPGALALFACVLLAADLVAGSRSGSHMAGDALYHIARVRMLLDNGFNSWDPLIGPPRSEPAYPANLQHALLAAAAQLTRQTPAAVWAFALPWAKLLSACAIAHLAFIVLGRRSCAWLACIGFVVWSASQSVLLLPSRMAVYAWLALAFAFTVELATPAEDPDAQRALASRRRAALGLAATCLVLAQVHALYYAFAVLLVAPVLVVRLALLTLRRAPGRRELVVAVIALGVGAPWPALTTARLSLRRSTPPVAMTDSTPRQGDAAQRAATEEPAADPDTAPAVTAPVTTPAPRPDHGFLHVAGGRMLDPSWLANPASPRLHLLIALIAGLFTARRPQVFALGGIVLAALATLHIPWLCGALIDVVRVPWVVGRLAGTLTAPQLAIVPGVLVLYAAPRWSPRVVGAVACAVVVAYAYVFGVDSEPWTRARHLANARDPAALHRRLERHAQRRALFAKHVRPHAVVAVPPSRVAHLVADCNCVPLAIPRLRRGLLDADERRLATTRLLDSKTPIGERVALLRQYDVHHLYAHKDRVAKKLDAAYRPLLREHVDIAGEHLLVLDLARAPQR
jgi:hypothetical protein